MQAKYPKLLFSLTYFRSVLLERRKFRTLDLNIPYDSTTTSSSPILTAAWPRLFSLAVLHSSRSFSGHIVQAKYQKLLFSLAYFHSVLLERRKFRTLGLNIPYDFNDTDFNVSDDLLKSYLDSYAATPWDALKYLIAEANYGGRVTDELDRRVLSSYLNKFYCEDALTTPNYLLSPLLTYYIPGSGPLSSYKDYVLGLPSVDAPEAFGQHPNAEISYLIEDSKERLQHTLVLQSFETLVQVWVGQVPNQCSV